MSAAAWALPGIDPRTASRLDQAVSGLHASTGFPEHEILAAIIHAGLENQDAVRTRLAGLHLEAVISALPPDRRPVPDVSVYDQLLTRRTPQA
jgi:hypothetical protein